MSWRRMHQLSNAMNVIYIYGGNVGEFDILIKVAAEADKKNYADIVKDKKHSIITRTRRVINS